MHARARVMAAHHGLVSMIRQTIEFSGRVQGVGFRYTAVSVAQGHAVAGYVQNLPGGTVRLVVEAEPADIESFVAELAQQMTGNISGSTREPGNATGEFGPPAPGAVTVRY